jgi:histone-lysine N-methyltransferase SETDB1
MRFEKIVGNKKEVTEKLMQLKHLAYFDPAPIRLLVGTRIIGLFKDGSEPGAFYSGIIAEPPKQMNRFRYLVFFDDGYALYVHHSNVRVVCQQSPLGVWEDVDPNSRNFVYKYLEKYPDRPMVKLTVGQVVRTELQGSWWLAQVEEVDASLVRLFFNISCRREWVYRGSTRLGPLFAELQAQEKKKEAGARFLSRRLVNFNRNRPYVEYTRQMDEDQEPIL